MTPMIGRARDNARKVEARNVEFRLGEIEHLPVADGTIDAILSNCVINLSPEKAAVFAEALRVLKRAAGWRSVTLSPSRRSRSSSRRRPPPSPAASREPRSSTT